jgi:hypothetical protein
LKPKLIEGWTLCEHVNILGTTSIQVLMTIGRRKKIEIKIVVKNKAIVLVKVLQIDVQKKEKHYK